MEGSFYGGELGDRGRLLVGEYENMPNSLFLC